jgi:hypothetical protein
MEGARGGAGCSAPPRAGAVRGKAAAAGPAGDAPVTGAPGALRGAAAAPRAPLRSSLSPPPLLYATYSNARASLA